MQWTTVIASTIVFFRLQKSNNLSNPSRPRGSQLMIWVYEDLNLAIDFNDFFVRFSDSLFLLFWDHFSDFQMFRDFFEFFRFFRFLQDFKKMFLGLFFRLFSRVYEDFLSCEPLGQGNFMFGYHISLCLLCWRRYMKHCNFIEFNLFSIGKIDLQRFITR